MKIPEDSEPRFMFYQDLIRKCNASREMRREFYSLMRTYYLWGVDNYSMQDTMGRFNNIFPHCDQLSSFMFSPETTRFTINIGPSVSAEENYKVAPMVQGIHREWHGQNDNGLDTDFKEALDWSLAYGSMFLKFRWRNWQRKEENGEVTKGGGLQHFLVEPHNFGVLREDKRGLYKQEACCETYFITKSQLYNELDAAAHRDKDYLMSVAQVGPQSVVQSNAGPVDRLIVTSIQGGSITGNASMWGSPLTTMYRPTTIEDLIEMQELYVYDDKIMDWRIVTMMNQQHPIWDRPIGKIFVPQTLPYIQICPRPANDYFWGHSEVEKLIPLQDMLNERIADIRHLLKKQAHAPSSVTGETAVPDEMQLAMDTPAGLLAIGSPGANINNHQPTVPNDLWNDVRQIKEFFGEVSGLPPINQGKGEQGVRSKGQAQLASQLGSTRPKNRALIIEECLDATATLIVKCMKKFDKRPYREEKDDEATEFFAAQFTDDFEAKVDGHSNSPVFMENTEEKVFGLFDRQVIDKEMLLQLIDLPLKQLAKVRLKTKIEPAEAAAHKEEVDLKKMSILAKRNKGNPPEPQSAAG